MRSRKPPPKLPGLDPAQTSTEVASLKKQVQKLEEKIRSARSQILEYQIEQFNIESPTKRAFTVPLAEKINETIGRLNIVGFRLETSEKLIEAFKRIVDTYPKTKNRKGTPVSPTKKTRPAVDLKALMLMTPLERAKRAARLGPSRMVVKKKVATATIPQLAKTQAIPKQSEKSRGKELLDLMKRDLVELDAAASKIRKRFGTTSPNIISGQIKTATEVNKELHGKAKAFSDECRKLLRQRDTLMRSIEELKEPCHERRVINEGNEYLEKLNEKITELLDEASKRIEFGHELLDGIARVSAVIDPDRVPPGGALEELMWIRQKLSGVTNKVEARKDEEQGIENIWNLNATIPRIPVSKPDVACVPALKIVSPVKRFRPETRMTRRAMSALNSFRPSDALSKRTVDEEMNGFGKLLGNLIVHRFFSSFHTFDEDIEVRGEPVPEATFESTENDKILQIFELYTKFKGSLHLSQLTDAEIEDLDPSVLEFSLAKRAFKENCDVSKLIGEATTRIETDLVVSLWVITDFITNELIGSTLDILRPVYDQRRSGFSVDELDEVCAWVCLFNRFYQSGNDSIQESITELHTTAFARIVDQLFQSLTKSSLTKCTMLALVKYASHNPSQFENQIEAQGRPTKLFETIIERLRNMPTFVSACCDLFISALDMFDIQAQMWAHAYFFCLTIYELCRNPIRPVVLSSFLRVIREFVVDRKDEIVDQMHRFHYLHFLHKNFELEELMGAKLGPPEPAEQPPTIAPMPAYKPTESEDDEQIEIEEEEEEEEEAQDFGPPQGVVVPSLALGGLAVPPLAIKPDIPVPKLGLDLGQKVTYNDVPPMKLDLNNPKLQLQFHKDPVAAVRRSMSGEEKEYMQKRKQRPIYVSVDIHCLFVEVILATLIRRKFHRFDVTFCDPFPHVNKKMNILFTVMQHMESTASKDLTDPLVDHFTNAKKRKRARAPLPMGVLPITRLSLDDSPFDDTSKDDKHEDFSDALCFLRLVTPWMFDFKKYNGGKHIANGAFGSVMMVDSDKGKLAVKILKKSRNEFENPHLYEVFTEVSILKLCVGDRRVTQLFDYGVTASSYYIVMEFYPMTLKAWRRKTPDPEIGVILRLYREVLLAATVLPEKKINHFDIKCDNVMLDATGHPCIADFGESMLYTNERDCNTMLNKGTEWIKSPEMLSIAITSTVTNPTFDRRKKIGAGPLSDIWSLGCLFYELVTCEFLFADPNWSRFYMRVTESNQELIFPEQQAKLPADPRFMTFLTFILQREVRLRPNLNQVIARFDEIFPESKDYPLPSIPVV